MLIVYPYDTFPASDGDVVIAAGNNKLYGILCDVMERPDLKTDPRFLEVMHKVADAVQAATSLPLLHIAELTADELEAAGVSTVGLLGTRYTMEQDFYTRKLVERGITVLIPEEDGRAFVNRVIFDELCLGTVSESSRRAFAAIIGGLTARGAQGVILGCTEIGLLVRPGDTSARLFDTTEIHARRAALYALGEAVPRDGGE